VVAGFSDEPPPEPDLDDFPGAVSAPPPLDCGSAEREAFPPDDSGGVFAPPEGVATGGVVGDV
jgi:hypothetical protein